MPSQVARPASVTRASGPPGHGAALIRAALLGNALLVAAIWIDHGGLDAGRSLPRALISTGELAALYGTLLALAGLVLVARTPLVERLYGDRGARYHRLIGVSVVVLISLHVGCTIAGYALTDKSQLVDEFVSEVVTYPYMLAALAGFVLLIVIGLSSMRPIRSHLSHETWTGVHLYAYLAIVLAFGHQLAVGSDFVDHTFATAYWVALYIGVFALIVRYRLAAPFELLARHRFRVTQMVVEAPGVVSIYIGGRNLDRLPAQAGQYFRLRLIARNEWWRSNPFSISAVPDGSSLRFTVKAMGDFSERLQAVRIGTRVMLEGPYGAMTSSRRTMPGVALIGGGIGVTPIRALFEELSRHGDVKLLYRASRPEDVVFWDELAGLERPPRATVTWLIGRRGSPAMPADPFSPSALGVLVPDIVSRDVFVCGPGPMMDHVERSLRELGVPKNRIHSERFAA
jgi:predicted ferric reductase